MTKILLIKAKRTQIQAGGIRYTYPAEYDSKKIQVLCYEFIGENLIVNKRDLSSQSYEFLIGVVSDEDAKSFLKSIDIIEISKAEAIEKGRKWRPQIDKIIDYAKVLPILAKTARGESLTNNELNIITPNAINTCIVKSKLFDDLLSEYM